MKKSEMIEQLFQAGAGTKTALKKKSEEELTELMSGLETVESAPVKEEKVVAEKAAPEEGQSLLETNHQLGIFTEYMYHVKNVGSKIKVENLGGGDVYIGGEQVQVGAKELRLLTLESRVFEGHAVLHMIAASQPEVKITEMK